MNIWNETDVDNELREHLESGYKDLHTEYFGAGRIKERIDKYNEDVSDLLARINQKFAPRAYKVQLRFRKQARGESIEKMSIVDDAGHFKLQDEEGGIYSDADKKKVESLQQLIENDGPTFIEELRNIDKRREKLSSDIQSFQQKLSKEFRHLRQYDDLRGRCNQCKKFAASKFGNPFRKEGQSSEGLSDNTTRREAVDIAVIVLIATFLFTFGAILLSVSLAFAFGALPTIVERANSNVTSTNDAVAKVYEALSAYSLQYTILGAVLLLGGLALGLLSLAGIQRRIPRT
jgi:hypothetical protein